MEIANVNANSNSYVRGPLRVTQKGNGFCVNLRTQKGLKINVVTYKYIIS